MAIRVNGEEVINNNRRGNFSMLNLKSYTLKELDDLVVKGDMVGDAVYNSDTNNFSFWDGERWTGSTFIAVGGRVVKDANYTYHIFSNPGSLTFVDSNTVEADLLVVGGGGGGGRDGGGGGGGGTVVWKTLTIDDMNNLRGIKQEIVVGRGGAGGTTGSTTGDKFETSGKNGGMSKFGNITAPGGGGGGAVDKTRPGARYSNEGNSGGCGGGGGGAFRDISVGGAGNITNPGYDYDSDNASADGISYLRTGRPGGRSGYSYDNYFAGGGGGGAGTPDDANPGSGPNGNMGGQGGVYGGLGGWGFGITGFLSDLGTSGPDNGKRYFGGGGSGMNWVDRGPVSWASERAPGGGGLGVSSRNRNPQEVVNSQAEESLGISGTGGGGGGLSYGLPTAFGKGGDGIVVLRYVTG